MKKTLLTSILTITLTLPAMAEITSGATCDTTNLGQSENNSTANVEADWTANTININWWSDNTSNTPFSQTTCTYDGTITLPQTAPTRTGYTFAGWQLAGTNICNELNTRQTCNANNQCLWNINTNKCISADSEKNRCAAAKRVPDCESLEYCMWSGGSCVTNIYLVCHGINNQTECQNTIDREGNNCRWDVDNQTCLSNSESI